MDRHEILKRVKEYMMKNRMTEKGDGILAAVSGGADSICLLFLLWELKEELGIRLAAFHLNHGMRGEEARRDEEYVKQVCERLGVALVTAHEDVNRYAAVHKISGEEAGRKLRYLHLSRAAEELSCNKIAAAHHRDDQAETVLLNLFRGSGLNGLSGIRPVRENIIRPLLCLTRGEIEEYLEQREILWCEDSTNRECVYTRNRIRNQLIPWVRENINDRAAEHILNTAQLAGQADEYFSRLAEKLLEEEKAELQVRTDVFDGQPDIVKGYLVRAMVSAAAGSRKDISARHIQAVCALTGPGGGTEAVLPYGLKAVRTYTHIKISGASVQDGGEKGRTEIKMRVIPRKKAAEIPKNLYTKWFDYDKIKGALSVRNRENGDFFMITGEKKKLLKRFFIDEKIPEAERGEIPLLAEGNHILWAVGYRISEYYKITDRTRTILEVRVCKGEEDG